MTTPIGPYERSPLALADWDPNAEAGTELRALQHALKLADAEGLDAVAARCTEESGGAFTIRTEPLPNSADTQREQLGGRFGGGQDSSPRGPNASAPI